ncbi:SPT10 protein [Plectosphaerella plurivora]|uniref:SPT10 protein n=1 Tax=Plectosphaerella plurivora TaxID=936078 RepID=A0A9P9AAP1_9PEZI|nr:SPT10 protein [Plectosphaerella plurivora]
MPAMLDDPGSPTIYRVSGAAPFPDPSAPPSLPEEITPRQTIATVVPFASKDQVPASLLRYLADQLNKEIEGGDTYPMMETMPHDKFASYWFQNFGAIMLLGSIKGADEVAALFPDPPADAAQSTGTDWSKTCLGSFYIKPNYPGRSSHVCNAGFLVTDAARNRGVGRLMGESYLDWAPKLGYTYSVFNLVYETNVASCKIWDALGFKRIGRVKGCGNLRSYPDRLVDAIIYGRDLLPVTEERFDKIKYYLKYGKYPAGADRAEKSRLRSAATHYKLVEPDTLMLKDKEVVPDPRRQYDIARETHVAREHGGINKTTAHIAERYHWSRIKETVSDVIRNCTECKELGKMPAPGGNGNGRGRGPAAGSASASRGGASSSPSIVSPPSVATLSSQGPVLGGVPPSSVPVEYGYPSPEDVAAHGGGITPSHTLRDPSASPLPSHQGLPLHNPMLQDRPQHHHHHPHHHDSHLAYQPIDPQMISQPHSHTDAADPYGYGADSVHDHDPQTETDFQALLNATEDSHDTHVQHTSDDVAGAPENDAAAREREREAMARDLDMLIDPGDEEEDSAMTGVVDTKPDHVDEKAP